MNSSTLPLRPARYDELDANGKIDRLRYALDTLAFWLVSAQTGFGQNDAVALRNLVEYGQTKEPSDD